MKRFELTDLAEQTIDALRKEGVEVSPQDVLTIQALSLKATGGAALLKGRPRFAGGATFWPLTVGAACWFGDFLRFTEERGAYGDLTYWAYAYASAHARNPITRYGEEAVREIRSWKRTLCATRAEIEDAVSGTMGETVNDPGETDEGVTLDGDEFDREDLAALLVSLCGGDYEAWRWTAGIHEASRIVAQVLALKAAEHGGGGGDAASVEGLKELAKYTSGMRARAKDGAEG